jgi:hypothetical protein
MAEALIAPCPFCDSADQGRLCAWCGRDRTTTCRKCWSCRKVTPSADPVCCHCGAPQSYRWQRTIIIAVFVVAVVVALTLQIGFD